MLIRAICWLTRRVKGGCACFKPRAPRPKNLAVIALLAAAALNCDARGLDSAKRSTAQASALHAPPQAPLEPDRARTRAPSPTRPRHFREAKRLLAAFYATRTARTVYSGCPLQGGSLDWAHCCLAKERAHRGAIEWEHVVPAAAIGARLPEWRDGHERCQKRGRPFRGRKCARRASTRFQQVEGDMHNLFPELGDVNGARGSEPMGTVTNPTPRHRELAGCGLTFGEHTVEPRPGVRGDVARAYLYMNDVYPDLVVLTDEARATYEQWHTSDPPDELEHARNRMIHAEQGNENPWIR